MLLIMVLFKATSGRLDRSYLGCDPHGGGDVAGSGEKEEQGQGRKRKGGS